MSRYILENEWIRLEVDSTGAEIKSLQRKSDRREYMWCADKRFWGRTSPVLFPIVGSLNNKTYRWNGKEYEMSQHGFARDREFTLSMQNEDTIWMRLEADEKTKENYPFDFSLELGYQLEKMAVRVLWKVTNLGNEDMHFSIGGHPAFLCPIAENTKQTDYFIWFDTDKILKSTTFENGMVGNGTIEYPLDDGYLRVTENLFDEGALIIEHDQVHKVALCMPDKTPYLTVRFDVPLFGVWSPEKKHAPFICIEPWYGRGDRNGFSGELSEREWGNTLKGQESFEASYVIEVNEK